MDFDDSIGDKKGSVVYNDRGDCENGDDDDDDDDALLEIAKKNNRLIYNNANTVTHDSYNNSSNCSSSISTPISKDNSVYDSGLLHTQGRQPSGLYTQYTPSIDRENEDIDIDRDKEDVVFLNTQVQSRIDDYNTDHNRSQSFEEKIKNFKNSISNSVTNDISLNITPENKMKTPSSILKSTTRVVNKEKKKMMIMKKQTKKKKKLVSKPKSISEYNIINHSNTKKMMLKMLSGKKGKLQQILLKKNNILNNENDNNELAMTYSKEEWEFVLELLKENNDNILQSQSDMNLHIDNDITTRTDDTRDDIFTQLVSLSQMYEDDTVDVDIDIDIVKEKKNNTVVITSSPDSEDCIIPDTTEEEEEEEEEEDDDNNNNNNKNAMKNTQNTQNNPICVDSSDNDEERKTEQFYTPCSNVQELIEKNSQEEQIKEDGNSHQTRVIRLTQKSFNAVPTLVSPIKKIISNSNKKKISRKNSMITTSFINSSKVQIQVPATRTNSIIINPTSTMVSNTIDYQNDKTLIIPESQEDNIIINNNNNNNDNTTATTTTNNSNNINGINSVNDKNKIVIESPSTQINLDKLSPKDFTNFLKKLGIPPSSVNRCKMNHFSQTDLEIENPGSNNHYPVKQNLMFQLSKISYTTYDDFFNELLAFVLKDETLLEIIYTFQVVNFNWFLKYLITATAPSSSLPDGSVMESLDSMSDMNARINIMLKNIDPQLIKRWGDDQGISFGSD